MRDIVGLLPHSFQFRLCDVPEPATILTFEIDS